MNTNIPLGLKIRALYLLFRAFRRFCQYLSFLGLKSKMSWAEFSLAVKILVRSMSRDNPDVILGIGIGGSITGATIAGNLGKPFLSFDREVEWNGSRDVSLLPPDFNEIWASEYLSGKKVLIVSAEIVSGQTITSSIDLINKYNPKEIFSCCIDFNPLTGNKAPNYYYTESKDIIQKPWRILSTYPNPDDNAR